MSCCELNNDFLTLVVGPWRSLVARLNGVQEVASSNLAAPISCSSFRDAELRDELSVSDPVLSKHIKQLEMVGYLNLRKSTPDALPTTDVYALTGDCSVRDPRDLPGWVGGGYRGSVG